MDNRKLTQRDFEHGPARETFSHLQHLAGLSEQGRGRVDDAMKAAVAHVEKTRGLQYGMQSQHVDMALNFLDKHYAGRHDLKTKERELVKETFKRHFNIKDELPPETHEEKETA